MIKPPKLTEGYKKNFSTLQKAQDNGDLALLSAIRKRDNKPVALVCATYKDNEEYVIIPLAEMCSGNPYEDYLDPTEK